MTIPKPMFADELAARLGIAKDTLYRNRAKYQDHHGMPAPIVDTGRLAWERTGIEIWLTRHDPRRPRSPVVANDLEAPLVPATREERLAALHDYYRSKPALT